MKKATVFDVRHPSISTVEYVDFTHLVVDFLFSNRLEIFMFFTAVLSYVILYCSRLPSHRDPPKRAQAEQTPDIVQEDEIEVEKASLSVQQVCSTPDPFSATKAALRKRSFGESLECLKEVKAAWNERGTTERLVPHSVVSGFVEIACDMHQFGELVRELQGLQLPDKSINAMLAKCIGSDAPDLVRYLERLARAQREVLTDSTYVMLVQAMGPRHERIQEIVEEVIARDSDSFSPDLASALLKHGSICADVEMGDRLLAKMKPKQMAVLGEFMWFYIGLEQFEKACDVYEIHMQPVLQHGAGIEVLPSNMQESIIDVAVLCGRTHVAQQVINASKPQQALIKNFVEAFMREFERWNAVIIQWVVLVF